MSDLVDEEIELGGGMRLVLARPRAPADLLDAAAAHGRAAPYWAELWPSARALAAHVAVLPLAGVRAIELGCGLGLVALAAAAAGAEVLATDLDPAAVELVRANAARTGLAVRAEVADLADARAFRGVRYPLVLAADVLYEEPLAAALATRLPALTAPGGQALVAAPWPGQAERLAAALAPAGMRTAIARIAIPGRPGARTVDLLTACHGRVPAHTGG